MTTRCTLHASCRTPAQLLEDRSAPASRLTAAKCGANEVPPATAPRNKAELEPVESFARLHYAKRERETGREREGGERAAGREKRVVAPNCSNCCDGR